MIELVLFVILAVAALGGAVAVVFSRNPVHSALGLLATMLALAVLYVVQLAHFVAAVQVIVYAGAVMTLFLFVIMFIGVDREEDTSERIPRQRALVAALTLIVVVGAATLALGGEWSWVPAAAAGAETPNGTVEAVAMMLFEQWVLPFEVISLLLVVAAAGAIAVAYFRPARRSVEPIGQQPAPPLPPRKEAEGTRA
jgi:NADH-quinone oxidoreductase subunit J